MTALSKSCNAALTELDVDLQGAAYIVLVDEVLMQLGFTAPGQDCIRLQHYHMFASWTRFSLFMHAAMSEVMLDIGMNAVADCNRLHSTLWVTTSDTSTRMESPAIRATVALRYRCFGQ
jgi:hypothetical protein